MNMLAVDCCLRLTSVALMIDDGIHSESLDLGRGQSAELPHMTERIIRAHGLTFSDIDYVALTNGPGYFTGIRVGAAYASGLAYASVARIIPVSSLDVLTYPFRHEHKVLALVYAGHGFVYASCSGSLDAGEYSHEQIASWFESNTDARIISDDPERIAMSGISMSRVTPDVSALCNLARERLISSINPMELRITYYRAPQGVS